MATPKKNVAYEFSLTLVDVINSPSFRVNPTIAAGDFQVSIDGGSFANLATLPVVEPSGSVVVKVSLSAVEMDGDKVLVQGIDIAGQEWEDVLVFIDVPEANEIDQILSNKILRNKMITDPVAGTITVFDDDGIAILVSANLYEDSLAAQQYQGSGAERRERLT